MCCSDGSRQRLRSTGTTRTGSAWMVRAGRPRIEGLGGGHGTVVESSCLPSAVIVSAESVQCVFQKTAKLCWRE